MRRNIDVGNVSVIIPCFNQGKYIDDAVYSVLNQTYQDLEIIIINDGSTDPDTIRHLQNYHAPKTQVIHRKNCGLAQTRNFGIKQAKGDYILPLDADDKISSDYLEKAVTLLDAHQHIKIVYGASEYFGDKTEPWKLPPYSFRRLLLKNMIYCTALFRRKDFEQVGGYNQNMIYGWEDWDLWLSMLEQGGKAHKIPGIIFYYRKHNESMVDSLTQDKINQLTIQLYNNHKHIYQKHLIILFWFWVLFFIKNMITMMKRNVSHHDG